MLASHRGIKTSSARIAAEGGIPHKYLESILNSLRQAGFVTSTKGPSGGYALTADPSTIRLVAVFDSIEPESAPASLELLNSIVADLRGRLEQATVAEALMREQARRSAVDYVI